MNFAHLHLLLNHIPVFTTLFGLILIVASRLGKAVVPLRIGLYTLIAGAIFAVPAYLTGEPAEAVIERMAGIAPGAIDTHEDIAAVALGSSIALGLYAVLLLFWLRSKAAIRSGYVLGLLIVTTISSGLYVATAYEGGKIHHPETASTSNSTQANGAVAPLPQHARDDND